MSVNELSRDIAGVPKPCYEPYWLLDEGLLARPSSRKIFGAILKQLVDESPLTQAAIAKAIGVSPGTITHMVKGRSPANLDQLEKLADLFGVPIPYLLGGPRDLSDPKMDINTALRLVTEVVKKAQQADD